MRIQVLLTLGIVPRSEYAQPCILVAGFYFTAPELHTTHLNKQSTSQFNTGHRKRQLKKTNDKDRAVVELRHRTQQLDHEIQTSTHNIETAIRSFCFEILTLSRPPSWAAVHSFSSHAMHKSREVPNKKERDSIPATIHAIFATEAPPDLQRSPQPRSQPTNPRLLHREAPLPQPRDTLHAC